MRIEFGELRIGETAKKHLFDVINTNWASAGPKVKLFEKSWGELFNYTYNISMSSGTDADINVLMALYDYGAQRGDEIIVPALAFAAVGNAVLAAGFKPVFIDIERHTLNINPFQIEDKISPKTRAIFTVHTMGKPCKMDVISNIAKKHKLMLFEDSCEAHGAKFKGKFVGHWSDAATFSYYAAHLICCGEGGMVSSNDENFSKIVRSTKSHGRKDGSIYFDHVRPGLNSKMNDLEASLGLEGVDEFWDTYNARKENLNYLLKKVSDLKQFAFFNLEEETDIVAPHAFSIVLKDSKYNLKRLYDMLEKSSVKCKRNFGSMPTQHKAFAFLGHSIGEFPESEYVGDNGLHFGIHQYLSREDLDYVSDLLHEYFSDFA